MHQRLMDAEKDVRFPRRTCHRCGRAPFSEGGAGRARKTSAKAGGTNSASAPPLAAARMFASTCLPPMRGKGTLGRGRCRASEDNPPRTRALPSPLQKGWHLSAGACGTYRTNPREACCPSPRDEGARSGLCLCLLAPARNPYSPVPGFLVTPPGPVPGSSSSNPPVGGTNQTRSTQSHARSHRRHLPPSRAVTGARPLIRYPHRAVPWWALSVTAGRAERENVAGAAWNSRSSRAKGTILTPVRVIFLACPILKIRGALPKDPWCFGASFSGRVLKGMDVRVLI